MRWLGGRASTPVVSADGEIAVPTGRPLDDPELRLSAEAVVDALAAATRALHDLDPTGCPRVLRTVERVAHLRTRAPSIDTSVLSPSYRRHGAAELLDVVDTMLAGTDDDLVVTHGFLAPGNVLVDANGVSGLVGLDDAAVADRYRDLAIAAIHLAAAYPVELLGRFFTAYGLERPALMRLDAAQILAELESAAP